MIKLITAVHPSQLETGDLYADGILARKTDDGQEVHVRRHDHVWLLDRPVPDWPDVDFDRILEKVRSGAHSFVDSVGAPWADLPAAVAEAALVDLCSAVTDQEIPLEAITLRDVGRALGIIDEKGEWK